MSALRRLLPPLLTVAGLAVLGACGTPGGPAYEVDYFDTGPVGYWPGFYGRPWYGNNGVYVHPPHWAAAGGGLPHIPTAARPSRGRPAARASARPASGERR